MKIEFKAQLALAAASAAAVLLFGAAAQAQEADEDQPAPATEAVERALPPADPETQPPEAPTQAAPYGEIEQNHSFGVSLGLGAFYGKIQDPFRDDYVNPSSLDIGFHYQYQIIPYLGVGAGLQFLQGTAVYNHNGVVQPGDVVVNRNGSVDLSLIPISAGITVSPGFFSINPYLAGGGLLTYWNAWEDATVTQDGTYRYRKYSRDRGGSVGYYLAAGVRLKPRKYYSYFIEYRFIGMPSEDLLDEYRDFDMRNYVISIGFQFDYVKEQRPKY